MRTVSTHFRRGFTLMETVIAIGVLAVLLTAFMAVFGPATQGIRRSINVQEADRLAATLEKELSVLRPNQAVSPVGSPDDVAGGKYATAFNKAFYWLRESGKNDSGIVFVYQYRGNPSKLRVDGTMEPFIAQGEAKGVPGKDYIVQSIARLRSDALFQEDFKALEGRVFAVVARQLVFEGGSMKPGDIGVIKGTPMTTSSSGSGGATGTTLVEAAKPDDYGDAVIAFTAMFFDVPSALPYLKPGGTLKLNLLKLRDTDSQQNRKPIFTRNLGVRR